jgi:serine/threonine protein kinase
MVKKVGKYEIGRTLGEGTFGKCAAAPSTHSTRARRDPTGARIPRVKFAVNTETNERVAIKILDKEKIQKQNMGEQIKKEIAVMKMVKQRHVLQRESNSHPPGPARPACRPGEYALASCCRS